MNDNYYDVIIVGAGHAGCESALACARIGIKTLIVTIDLDKIANMPCNPSIGGPAKGNIVREIDALGGEMAKNIDETFIHIRLLNTSNGPAVQSLRAQAEKKDYHIRMKNILEKQENLSIKQFLVEEILHKNKKVVGIKTNIGETFFCHSLIIATGTFLNGVIHIGNISFPAGRLGEISSKRLSDSIKSLGFEMIRLKTGTVARINKKSLNYGKLIEQKSSDEQYRFSFFGNVFNNHPRVSCYQTFTNSKTHEVIKKNINKSALYSGNIKGIGPRFCPSIEDKIKKFPDKERHPVFLEPEGIKTEEMYLQGLSTSLPMDIQTEYIRTIDGLENAEIMRPGYAIEYDAIKATNLYQTLESKLIENLYFAGQVNGTSGYEEAAGQGLIAGINSALKIKNKEQILLSRLKSYIGVMINDIVTKELSEPYRIFTSRAENRIFLRHDNADFRLSHIGHKIGLIDDESYLKVLEKYKKVYKEKRNLKLFHVKHLTESTDDKKDLKLVPIYNLIKSGTIKYEDCFKFEYSPTAFLTKEEVKVLENEIKYDGYMQRQKEELKYLRKLENINICSDINYDLVDGLSYEAKEILKKVKPQNLLQASNLMNVTSADILTLLYYLKKRRN